MENLIENGPKRSRKGCVVEIVIAFFIILIFAAIVIPIFLKFQAKARNPEPKCNFGALYTCQMAYFAEHNTYAGSSSDKSCFELLNWDPEGDNYYSYYCGADKVPCKVCKTYCPDPPPTPISRQGFTLLAIGNIEDDSTCEVWSLNDAKQIKKIVIDMSWIDILYKGEE